MPEVKPISETQQQIWDRNCMEYGKFISKKFSEGKVTLKTISECEGIREFLCCTYTVMTRFEMCEKIENVELTLKKEMWELAKENKGTMSQKDMIDFCKCLLVIEILM